MKVTININGSAGKGSLWLGKRIAENFLGKFPDQFATFIAEYQSGVRVGQSRALVVLSDQTINCPFVESADLTIDLDKKEINCRGEKHFLSDQGRVNEQALSWFEDWLGKAMVK